ncbi:hypothetical protein AQS8620_03097 [Aquimixticola soesokkakensis]|uniref:Hedgehog/Intein (Hint) domain-containing protein n=1 Tax=Aquimixticola soesokkakensis TaxID=1519096 RepID=A0A1Y5TLL0_9RHOB|nr:Hint domain-containing protein [Aquimixticola soesokkakensis]SLN66728.1 hypothetical protein AQS8620_03097 [Aquimixticola soesokkakensis]
MASRTFALFNPITLLSSGRELVLSDEDDRFFETPADETGSNQSATLDGNPVTINSITTALGPQVILASVDGIEVSLNLTPVRVVIESGFFDSTFIMYPDLPEGATVIAGVSLPLFAGGAYDVPLCVTADAMIACGNGKMRPIGDLAIGDLVDTLDHGLQGIRWIGRRVMEFGADAALDKHRPILIQAGALGPGHPAKDLRLSPQHCVLYEGWEAELYFGEEALLVPAKMLVNGTTIRVDRDCDSVEYMHILCENHEILSANGLEVESLFSGDLAIDTIAQEAREELREIYQDLRHMRATQTKRARRHVKNFEARLIAASIKAYGGTHKAPPAAVH